MRTLICFIALAVVNFSLQASSWGQIESFHIIGSATFSATGVNLGTGAFSGNFSVDLSSLDDNPAIDEGVFELVDVDIEANAGTISAGTLTQRIKSSGQIEQRLFFTEGPDSIPQFGITISLTSDNPWVTDPNTIAFFNPTNVSVQVDLVEEIGATSQLNDFGISYNDFAQLGDCNLDGVVNFSDIGPFIAILAADSYMPEADINGDGAVTFSDIPLFVEVLLAL